MTVAFVFPGQGSQAIGMLSSLRDDAAVAATLAEADDALGFGLGALIADGPEELLNRTDHTQPAMLAAGVAIWRAWRAAGGAVPEFMAGHSLGEYTALVCSGAIDFGPALRLVRRRGEFMQAAVAEGEGAVAAILGLEDVQVAEACRTAALGAVVEAVNLNAPGQVVIAGHRAAVDRAIAHAKAAGARRAVVLPVSVPVHSSLMRPAAEALAEEIGAVALHTPDVPVINNVDVRVEALPQAIRDALVRQLYSPVRWVETVQDMRGRGVTTVVECGPGKVLAGLVRRIDRELAVHALADADTLAATRATLGG